MQRIVSVVAVPDWSVQVRFADGFEKRFDIRPFIRGGMSAPLADPDYFQLVAVDDMGGIYWPNGFDMCPDFVRVDVPAIGTAALATSA